MSVVSVVSPDVTQQWPGIAARATLYWWSKTDWEMFKLFPGPPPSLPHIWILTCVSENSLATHKSKKDRFPLLKSRFCWQQNAVLCKESSVIKSYESIWVTVVVASESGTWENSGQCCEARPGVSVCYGWTISVVATIPGEIQRQRHTWLRAAFPRAQRRTPGSKY